MQKEKDFSQLATDKEITAAAAALERNGIATLVANSGEEAKEKALGLIPKGAEVMNMTSMTLEKIGLADIITGSSRYDSVRNKLNSMDKENEKSEMRRLGAAPEWTVGSVHAVTKEGQVLVASASGSQLPAYAYGAGHVVWVVGAQKIVKDLEEAKRRIYEYVLPLENERALKAYGVGSGVNKLLIFNKEVEPGRVMMIIVKERLGF